MPLMEVPEVFRQRVSLMSAIEGKSTAEILLGLLQGEVMPLDKNDPRNLGRVKTTLSEQEELRDLARKRNTTPGQILHDSFRFTQMIDNALSREVGSLIVLDSQGEVRFKTIPGRVEVIIHPIEE